MIAIEFLEIDEISSLEKLAITAAEKALAGVDVDLSIAFTDDPTIHGLNNQYRGIDRATDVLSFSSEETDPESGRRYLGDIVISYERATQQAVEANNSVNEEVSMLVVHGVLHLLGYDHDTPEAKDEMWSLQGEILLSLGIKMAKFSGDD
jgi:probable rRNA maturation factor